ncbi:MAG: DEAD/DEAH box helicase family protein [Candidatus Dormibacteria bacterium]
MRIAATELYRYDADLATITEALNIGRRVSVSLKYFQYVAALCAARYVDLFDREPDRLLRSLAHLCAEANDQLRPAEPELIAPATRDELRKFAFWMATGSGKTLLLHVNWHQLRLYLRSFTPSNLILITPNAGLTSQHLRELAMSGIPAVGLRDRVGGALPLQSGEVIVTEITKFTQRKAGKSGVTVDVSAFSDGNVLFVDEGHRGATGEAWHALRHQLARRGFTFEYSATFGQLISGKTTGAREDARSEYERAIGVEYSYRRFYLDGYGKDYRISNVASPSPSHFDEDMVALNMLIVACQLDAYANFERRRVYGLERPLWVFVGHTVTGKTKDDLLSLTDVEQVALYIARFLDDREGAVRILQRVISRLKEPPLAGFAPAVQWNASEAYEAILRLMFGVYEGARLEAISIARGEGEIGLRAGPTGPYFGVINIGDSAGLIAMLASAGISTGTDRLSASLFDGIASGSSSITTLIGSRKFMEGWDSFRVSSSGLLNIGRGEGTQVLQMFGRGVRLRGLNGTMQRATALDAPPSDTAPLAVLQTLFVCGIRADYMKRFREEMLHEGIESDIEEFEIPVAVDLPAVASGLLTLYTDSALAYGATTVSTLTLDPTIEVLLDLRPSTETLHGLTPSARKRMQGVDIAPQLRDQACAFDWDRIWFDQMDYIARTRIGDVTFSRERLAEIWGGMALTVLALPGQFGLESIRDLRGVQTLVNSALSRYIALYHQRRVRHWLSSNARLKPLELADGNLAFGAYRIEASRPRAAAVRAIVRTGGLYSSDEPDLPSLWVQPHLYQPVLLHSGDQRSNPPALNAGEESFVRDLRDRLIYHSGAGTLRGEVRLLRNLSRHGLGISDPGSSETFYPDFVLWSVETTGQRIIFIDPHGLRHAAGGFSDPKVATFKDLAATQLRLQKDGAPDLLLLTSYIVSVTPYTTLTRTFGAGRHTKQEFRSHHVLFAEDSDYIEQILGDSGVIADKQNASSHADP